MTITVASPIVGKGGTVAEAVRWLGGDAALGDRHEYADELFRLCDLVGFDFRILFAQWAHETADGTSYWWTERRNPAGIGITGDPAQNAASPTFTNVTAARAHVVHMALYLWGESPAFLGPLGSYLQYDPRAQAVLDAGFGRSVRVLGDLGNGKWATDPNYAPQIAAKANAIFTDTGGSPVTAATVAFGKVPKPAVVNRHLDTSNPWISLAAADRAIEAVVWHRMIGSLNGTDGWFAGFHAATAYGIGVAATDGDALAGTIYEWIDPATRYYGESSGPVSTPYGDGALFVARFGVNRVNEKSEAIEISGNYDTPLDDKARAAIVDLTAYFADRRGIPWDQFPIVPGENRSFVIWHQEITIGTGKVCPGQVVMDETPALIAAVAARMKSFQGGTGPVPKPKPAAPIPSVPWDADFVGPHKLGDVTAFAFLGQATARRDVPVKASVGGREIGKIKAGATATIRGTFRSKSSRVALIDLGDKGVGRASLSAFHEKWPVL